MEFLLTCNSGLESVIKKEIQNLGYTITFVNDKLVYFTGEADAIAKVNLWSRAGNKLFILLDKSSANTFDELFESINQINRDEYIAPGQPILVGAHSIKSQLTNIPTIQSIAKKSITKKLLGGIDGHWDEDKTQNPVEILITIENDISHILINTTGNALHQRGYKTINYDAPIKENLAAGIISLATWRYSTSFYDFFCGSGTLPIEAAMIAKNIAPGMLRRFAFQDFYWFDNKIWKKALDEARDKIITDKSHIIIGHDINPKAIEIAQQHAKNAGVDKMIKFEQKDFMKINPKDYTDITMVSNPPYGFRLDEDDEHNLHVQINKFFENGNNINGGIITAYEMFQDIIDIDRWKLRKLYNGGLKSYFYKYIGNIV